MIALITESMKTILSLAPAVRAQGTYNGTLGGSNGWIDTLGYDEVLAQFGFGAVDDTLTDIDCEVYEADDAMGAGSKITITTPDGVSKSAEQPNLAGANVDNKVYPIDIRIGGRATGKRYIRPRLVQAPIGNSAAIILVHLGQPREMPVTQIPAAVVL